MADRRVVPAHPHQAFSLYLAPSLSLSGGSRTHKLVPSGMWRGKHLLACFGLNPLKEYLLHWSHDLKTRGILWPIRSPNDLKQRQRDGWFPKTAQMSSNTRHSVQVFKTGAWPFNFCAAVLPNPEWVAQDTIWARHFSPIPKGTNSDCSERKQTWVGLEHGGQGLTTSFCGNHLQQNALWIYFYNLLVSKLQPCRTRTEQTYD